MKYRIIAGEVPARTFALVFEIGDDAVAELTLFAKRESVRCAAIGGIGGFGSAKLGYYDMQAKRYEPIPIDEQVEVVSFLGNVTLYKGEPRVHVHCTVGFRGGATKAGHLLEATVRPTLELFVRECATPLERTDRPEIGIPLIAL